MGKAKTHDKFIIEMKEKNESIEILGKYQTSKTSILCHCNICETNWETEPRRLSSGQGCPSCAGNKRKTHAEYIECVYKKNPYITITSKYISNSSKISAKCNICENEWSTRAYISVNESIKCKCKKCNSRQILLEANNERMVS